MKRGLAPRAPSPTPTAFSGISNYRADSSYRGGGGNSAGAGVVPTIDYRQVSKTHFFELSAYLASYLARAPPNSRSTARQKLTRLTIQQFHELSTDVYDELVRRKNENEVPFLPVREEFHPKRNQARQKLATLPTSRFEDLSSDVYFELARRYPEFKEEESRRPPSPGSTYDDYPSPDFPTPPSRPIGAPALSTRSGRISDDRLLDNGYGGGISGRRPSGEERRGPPIAEFANGHRTEDGSSIKPTSDPYMSPASRRKPSVDAVRKSEDRDRDVLRRPSQSSTNDSTVNAPSSTAISGMIVPNKSTITEEDIEVPYGRDARESLNTALDDRDERSRERGGSGNLDSGRITDGEPESASDYASVKSPPFGGLSGLSARLRDVENEDDGGMAGGIGSKGVVGEDYYDKTPYGRGSASSERSIGGSGLSGRTGLGRASSSAADQEKIRSEYEYKIAKMQTQITSLQRDLGDADARERKWLDGEERVRQMEEELVGLRRRAEEQSTTMRTLQKELDELRELRLREQDREARRSREAHEELRALRERCEHLEDERTKLQAGDSDIMEQLRSNMQGLLAELSDLSRRNDESLSARESDQLVIRDLDTQLKEYKRKYELAKTELRNVKATSQLFLQAPNLDDQLPVSIDGGLPDIHVTAFLSAIDSLLTAGRSNSPTKVLTPMKSVVNAVTAIIDDIRTFERRAPRDYSGVDGEIGPEALRALRERAEATLSNLVTATKTHATSAGMSPVSLLDAAASHVSATVTEVGRTLCIRKATKTEQEQFTSPSGFAVGGIGAGAINGFSPSLRSVDEIARSSHSRKGSTASSRRSDGFSPMFSGASPSSHLYTDSKRQVPSEPSSSDASSPPPIFDQPSVNSGGVASDDSTPADGPEDAWAELKPYLEAQTESIVYAIQSVLSGVRSPTPSPTLNENLTQIITIVSSIVAVCNDNLPPASSRQGNEILRELSEHANKLSEVQALAEITKESRQIMAKSSFAVANAMKGLMKL